MAINDELPALKSAVSCAAVGAVMLIIIATVSVIDLVSARIRHYFV
jgi:ABC-type phosphate/phosphonate transport system permease subunit